MSELTVVQALSAVMEGVRAVHKDDRNDSQGFNFRGIDAVVNAVGPELRRQGVVVLPRLLSSTAGSFQTRSGTTMHTVAVEVEFTFVGPAGDTLSGSAPGEAADAGDKATPKAMSVAFRTFLLQALCIPTDEPDPDASSFERAAVADAMTAAQFASIEARRKDLDDAQRTALNGWYKAQRLPRIEALSTVQADLVLDELDRMGLEAAAAAAAQPEPVGS